MQIERDLERALRRKSPPAGFSKRVMERLRDERRKRRSSWLTMRAWFAAAVVTTAILAGVFVQHRIERARERIEGLHAKEQVMLAMHIASNKTKLAKERILEAERQGETPSAENGERP